MIQKAIAGIDKDDIDSIVTNQVKEGRTIEYKATLPGVKDAEKKEFLADVSSFANAAGGDLLYGVVEKRDEKNEPTGIPERIAGLPGLNADVEIRRLESMIQAGIGPRIAGVHLRTVDGFPDGPVLLIRVPKSYSAPHMVTFQEHSRFYSRNSSGKYPLDVGEIRAAFAASEELPKRIQSFRQERLGRIVAGETPIVLRAGPLVILHLVPLAALGGVNRFDLALAYEKRLHLAPLAGGGPYDRFNLDGLVTYISPENSGSHGYVQLFRNGIIESVEAYMLSAYSSEKRIPHVQLETSLISNLKGYLRMQQLIGLEPPTVLMLSLVGVEGYSIRAGAFNDTKPPIERDSALFPEALLEDLGAEPSAVLHPVFDAVWQAAGWPRCMNYNAQGEWEDSSKKLHV
jgi:hypothetical protein